MKQLSKQRFGIFLPALATAVVSSLPAASKDRAPSIHAPEFSSHRIEKFGKDRFETDAAGDILNGPRATPLEPVDYSSLLRPSVLENDFKKASSHCPNCKTGFFSWPDGELSFRVLADAETREHPLSEKLASVLNTVFVKAGIKPVPANHAGDAGLVIIIGGEDHLRLGSKKIGVKAAEDFYTEGDAADTNKDLLSVSRGLFDGTTCRVAMLEHKQNRKYYVFLQYEEIDLCLRRQLLISAGLEPFDGHTPSALNTAYDYKAPTTADFIFIRQMQGFLKTPSEQEQFIFQSLINAAPSSVTE
ncbi:MAG: hypothetical protein AB3N24_13030 [Leisingera sp.]